MIVPLSAPQVPGSITVLIDGPSVAGTITVTVSRHPPGSMGGPMSKLSSSDEMMVYTPGARPVNVYVGSKVIHGPPIPLMLTW